MFEQEAAGLDDLRKPHQLAVPAVLKVGVAGNSEYLLLEWIEKGTAKPGFWEEFGRGLAMMHKQEQPFFGWKADNYIGRLPQCNKKHTTWDEFYTECRIMPMVEILFNKGDFNKEDIAAAGSFCNQLDKLYPVEHPSLLHGDLWSMNFTVSSKGHPVIFDPSVYCGHREMDLGMTKLFGGFDRRFYAAYNEVYPLEHDWENRLKLSEAYPLLVHAVMFGGIYTSKARDILRYFNEWA
jgi:fructosamine-3-kinase